MGMTACRPVRLVAFSIAVSIACLTHMVAPAEEPKPWTLRDHYSFKGSEASLFFDVKTAEWKIEVNGLGSLTGNVQSEIDADGQTIVVSTLLKAKDERESFSSPLGDGTFFRSVFEPQSGLVVRYATTRLNEQAFMVMRMSVENVSNAPIEISAIRPAILAGGYLADHGAVVNPTMERAGHRGGFALIEESDALSVVRLDLNDSPASIGLGVLRSGDMESGLYLVQNGTKWTGRIECRFAPTLRLKPGETVEADPVWISFNGNDPALIRQMHGFAQTSLFPAPAPAEFPASWVAVDGQASAEDLFRIADSWAKAGMRHVLVNESIDGSLSSNAKALGKISKKLRAMGLITGVQIDPFAELTDDPDKWTLAASPRPRHYPNEKTSRERFCVFRATRIAHFG